MSTIKQVRVSDTTYDIIDAVSTWTVAGLTRYLSNATGDGVSSEITAEQLRTALGLTNAMHFIGIVSEDITDLSTTNPVTINEESVTAVDGDVIISGTKELVWANSKWNLMGDTGDFALKTITITGTGALGGGGNLTANRTITHNTYTPQNGNTTTGRNNVILNVVSDNYGHVTSVSTGAISATFTGKSATIQSTGFYTPSGTNQSSAVTLDTAGIKYSTLEKTSIDVIDTKAGHTYTVHDTPTCLQSKLATTTLTGVSGTTSVSNITAFNGGSAASINQSTFFSSGTLPTIQDSTWGFAVNNGVLNITGTNSTHTTGSLPSIDYSAFNGGSAATMTYNSETVATANPTATRLATGLADSNDLYGAAIATGQIEGTAINIHVPGSKSETVATGGLENANSSDSDTVITSIPTTGTAAAQIFTGVKETITSTGSYTPAGTIGISVD